MKQSILVMLLIFGVCTNAIAQQGEIMPSAQEVIEKLGLSPLPEEGGYYRETYRSNNTGIQARTLGIDADGERTISTAIYYLVVPESFSALHRVASDEIFHFYQGDPAEMIQISPDGVLKHITLGSDILKGQQPQVIVPKGHWQGLKLKAGGKWALMGTTVAPGFEFSDFELGSREQLTREFPQHEAYILQFSRGQNERPH